MVHPLSSTLTSGLGGSNGLPRTAELDDAVFEAAFEAHYQRVCLYALTMLRNAAEAEDAASETCNLSLYDAPCSR
jgi:DNA-directed RNA polymerase specialized sigma24 family protein